MTPQTGQHSGQSASQPSTQQPGAFQRHRSLAGVAVLACAWLALAIASATTLLTPPAAPPSDRAAAAVALGDMHSDLVILAASTAAPGPAPQPVSAWTASVAALSGQDAPPGLMLLGQRARAWPYAEARTAAVAYADLAADLASARAAAQAIQKQPQLGQGPYAAILDSVSQEQASLDPAAFVQVFAPIQDRAPLQQQWASHLADEATALAPLLARARTDAAMPQAATQNLATLTAAVSGLAASAKTLTSALPVRLQVTAWPGTVAEATAPAMQVLFQPPPASRFGFLVPIGLLLVSVTLVMAAIDAVRFRTRSKLQEVISQRSRLAMGSVEKMTRELRDILRDARTNAKVTEDAASPAFSLSSMVNQILNARHAFAEEAAAQGRESETDMLAFARALHGLSESLATYVNRVNTVRERGYGRAGRLAEMGSRVAALRTQAAGTGAALHEVQVAVQETSWKSDALRADAQAQAKRAKRMGEGTQSLGVVSGLLRQTLRGIQIASVNTAVASASLGETGRDSLALAQEIERLAQAAIQSLQEMDTAIRDMQEDAKAAVSLTEQGTARVLETGTCATRASSLVAGMERAVADFPQTLEQVVSELEKRALAEATDVEEAAALDSDISGLATTLSEVEAQSQRALVTLRQFLARLLPKSDTL